MYILIINRGYGWELYNASPYPSLREVTEVKQSMMDIAGMSEESIKIAKYID